MATATRTFRAAVQAGHKQCAVEVPFDPGGELGLALVRVRAGRHGYRVRASIGADWFEGIVVPRMRRWWLLIDPPRLDAAGGHVGSVVEVRLEAEASATR